MNTLNIIYTSVIINGKITDGFQVQGETPGHNEMVLKDFTEFHEKEIELYQTTAQEVHKLVQLNKERLKTIKEEFGDFVEDRYPEFKL